MGSSGQVGWELNRGLLPYGVVKACDKDNLDLLNESEIRGAVREFKPNVIINAAAYTAVDRAETDRETCRALNVTAPGVMAEEAEKRGAWMVHYSSDYVFNGRNTRPWTEDDEPDPINYYGQSKLEGDLAIMRNSSRYLIFRTSWVYASRGSNFLLTMLRLFANKNEVRVVNDQIGAPTWARYLAQATLLSLKQAMNNDDAGLSGVYNLVASGSTSWYDFAREIKEYAGGFDVSVNPISSAEYPVPAPRPEWSVLSLEKIERVFGVYAAPWRDAARLCIDEIKERQPLDE
ncbi:NAD(P)-dependent oxidoreductase [Synergistales bacterium]|nr:NAD(P)-dependent oxidoreductase [Synergistales bacterium]